MHLYDEYAYTSIENAMKSENISIYVFKVEKILKISTHG